MARQVSRISDLPAAEPLQGDELLEIVQGGENVRVRAYEFVHSGSVTHISFALIENYREKVSNIASGTISRFDGAWQVLTLTASEELDVSALTAGQSVTITVVGGDEYALTYAGVDRWSGAGQPTELLPTHDLTFAHNGVEIVGFDLGGTDAV